jgi:hypothetical protein
MLIDSYMPRWDVRERHLVHVAASPGVTFAALQSADLAAAPLVRALLALRALPAAFARGWVGVRELTTRGTAPVTLSTIGGAGFRVLDVSAPSEIVIGIEGRFWRIGGDVCTPDADAFRDATPAPGTARGVWNFSVAARPDGTTDLATETRVLCADAAARHRFLPYWFLIRPGSGAIRRAMLHAVREKAEASHA